MEFKNYSKDQYEKVCEFLIELNSIGERHINWNWARFEWMYEHPEFDKDSVSSIGLWLDGDRVVGAAIYDMYFGEAFCAALPGYEEIYPEILDYAYKELKDENGLGIAIRNDSFSEIETAEKAGFSRTDQTETIMRIDLSKAVSGKLPDGFSFYELDPAEEAYAFQWILWRGFDHGEDRQEFERSDVIKPQVRRHFNKYLSLAAVDPDGETAAYCCLWYSEKTDYAYVEPVCTAPSCRGRGIGKALVCEALDRAHSLGAERAFVISDQEFYEKLGFEKAYCFDFYWKNDL